MQTPVRAGLAPVTFNVGRTESGGRDIYGGLFADDLDTVADQLDRAFAKLNAEEMRAKPPVKSGQIDQRYPSKLCRNTGLARTHGFGAASGNRTPDLRITSALLCQLS